jgi:hypothetical protein
LATFTIQLSGSRRSVPERTGDVWRPRNRYGSRHDRPQRPDGLLRDHDALVHRNSAAVNDCVIDLEKNLLKDILRNPEEYYLTVHNAPFPAGAVRGQLS